LQPCNGGLNIEMPQDKSVAEKDLREEPILQLFKRLCKPAKRLFNIEKGPEKLKTVLPIQPNTAQNE
jgi:hypothetical protein